MGNTKIIISKTNEIKSVEDWRMYAPPQKPNIQWKDGRSAKLLAEYALSKNFIDDILEIIKDCNFCVPSILYGEPEVSTKLPASSRGPRKHDLLLTGNDFVIGVEAKVSESFDKTIKVYQEKKGDRLQRIVAMLKYLGKSIEEAGEYRYQLLTGLVGTLLEAKKRGKKKCLFLVISFTGEVNASAKNIEKNNKDFETFCSSLLGLTPNGGTKVYKIDDKEITCYIKKVNVKRHFTMKL